MDIAGARASAARIASALRRSRTGPAMRDLTGDLSAALRARPRPPAGVRDVCRALCEEMAARRGGRPVELRFERFPDEFDVTGLWVEFQDFDLVIVEERAEAVQQLVILGHELWHLHAGHRHHHHGVGTAAAGVLAAQPGWDDIALTVAARNGSRESDEAEADDFGHRLAAAFRRYLPGPAPAPSAETSPVQRTLGYRGRRGTAR
ncbi:toxin-antitoxin system, toxin component family protein [Streptomyces sp. NBC_01275]|uniref:toxin-antitoxin system, toxin component family protein n=1 Tax=Streptomyces sp. NBC_01275 TaxID=2903807 RepID=UPI00225AD0AD|nr:toxin-antitoxin system, toxin component family protein [Streptomyces sp. NBC_01275]MCX4761713.1 toxin-antitoxin system, toxin component family protein [Streptomyces sp. NBC_01275]